MDIMAMVISVLACTHVVLKVGLMYAGWTLVSALTKLVREYTARIESSNPLA